jgi:hypothetical protein
MTRNRMAPTLLRAFMLALNLFHMAVHGTFLDQGCIDAVLEPLDLWFIQINAYLEVRNNA